MQPPLPIMGVEDKRPIGFLPVIAELSKRAPCGTLETEIDDPPDQPNWWIVVNKVCAPGSLLGAHNETFQGALYAAAYKVNWVIFAGLTGFCIGHRDGQHMFWSGAIPNRRDQGDEFTSETLDLTKAGTHTFSNQHHPVPQTGLVLLFLAVVMSGAREKGSSWVQQMFPQLCALHLDPPTSRLVHGFTGTGRQIGDETDHDSGSSNSSSNDYTPSRSGSERSLLPTHLLSGHHRFTGTWYGDLSRTDNYSVKILNYIGEGEHGAVYSGELLQKGSTISTVAIKVSADERVLRIEFERYLAMQKSMGDSIPRCYGLFVGGHTMCLVVSLVPNNTPSRKLSKLSKAERGAIYFLMRKLHMAGWAHNDVVYDSSHDQSLHNLLWNAEGRPVLVDLVTVTRHICKRGCSELGLLQKVLKLSQHDIAVWAR
ncbi:hypothetical protein B0H12DRAFT_1246908 [Mycena haematopus]|nr:hypothetical protein B0H12DRAFT_1246908 [Mycena haematopus]